MRSGLVRVFIAATLFVQLVPHNVFANDTRCRGSFEPELRDRGAFFNYYRSAIEQLISEGQIAIGELTSAGIFNVINERSHARYGVMMVNSRRLSLLFNDVIVFDYDTKKQVRFLLQNNANVLDTVWLQNEHFPDATVLAFEDGRRLRFRYQFRYYNDDSRENAVGIYRLDWAISRSELDALFSQARDGIVKP